MYQGKNMDDSLLILTPTALVRILKAFALRMGLEEMFADSLAQVHIQTSPVHERWHNFLNNNCTSCAKSPVMCEFFHPEPRHISGNATPLEMRNAQIATLEMGKYSRCPAYLEFIRETKKE